MHVFTYGTLQVEEVWWRVAGKRFDTVRGHAHGYLSRRVRGADYPAMTQCPKESTIGLAYLEVDEDTLARLDRFEGAQYVRQEIEVTCEDGVVRRCDAYLLAGDEAHLLTDEPWSLQNFRQGEGLIRFCQRYIGFDAIL